MKEILFRFISIALIAVLAIGSTPFNFNHEHEDTDHCDHAEDLDQVSACHVSVYHSVESENEACEHNAHFADDEFECSWCSLLGPKRQKYHQPRLQSFETSIKFVSIDYSNCEFIKNREVSSKSSRAPPTLS